MKFKFLLLSCFCSAQLFAQTEVLTFPYESVPMNVDGIISYAEWSNAAQINIPVNAYDSVQVLYKHDMTAMYFAFIGKLESANSLFPEVLVDPDNLATGGWVNGQWWFHVSATDCENNGGYGVYNNCLAVQPGWEGAPNMAPGLPYTDSIEIRIPFNKIGFSVATGDTMGMAFLVTNTATIFKTYPPTSSKDVPSTWAKATFNLFPSSTVELTKSEPIELFPNPASSSLTVTSSSAFDYVITESTGRIISKGKGDSGTFTVPISHLPPAVYFLKTMSVSGHANASKFIKQ